jgi:hypothetical protein
MTKTLAAAATLLVLFAENGFSQSVCPQAISKPPRAFCEKGSSPEVTAFCSNLAALLSYAQTYPQAEKACFRPFLRNLDPLAREGVGRFITAVAGDLATRAAAANALREAGQARPDRQVSATSDSTGTTSLVSKAGSAELLSFALSTGALTRTINGTTATISTNGDQVFRLVTGSDPDCTVTCNSLGWFEDRILNPLNVLATFDLAQQRGTVTATSGQASGTTPEQVNTVLIPTGVGRLSGFTARYQLRNRFDPRGADFKRAWKAQVTSLRAVVGKIGDDTDAVTAAVETHSEAISRAQSFGDELLSAALSDPTGHVLLQKFEDLWSVVTTDEIVRDPKLATAVSKVIQDRGVYRIAWFRALDEAVGTLLTLEYNYNRPVNQPFTHDFRLIYGYNFQSMGMLTFNGSVSLYDTIPAGAKYGRLHYGQVSTQYDRTLSGKENAIGTQLSLAGYWQYQPHPSVLDIPAGTVAPGTTIPLPNGTQEFVGTAGSLWVTQAKLTIKGSGGINIPIGVSWSNKTDLLRGSRVGAQVGISYNFSSIAGLFSASDSQ